MATHSLIPMPSHSLVCKHGGGRPGPFYCVNDVSVYLGRQKRGAFRGCVFWFESGVVHFHFAIVRNSSTWDRNKMLMSEKKCGLELEKIQGMLTIHFSFLNKDSLSWRLFPSHLHWSFQEGTSPYDCKTITMNLGEGGIEFRRLHNKTTASSDWSQLTLLVFSQVLLDPGTDWYWAFVIGTALGVRVAEE